MASGIWGTVVPKRALTIAIALLALGGSAALPCVASANPTPDQAVANLNAWRSQLGELPVSTTTVAAWNTGCAHHNNYEHYYNENNLTHDESPGKVPGYTPDGYRAGRNSVLANVWSEPGPPDDAKLLPAPVWDGAVFHRAALLDPRLGQIGFASSAFAEGAKHWAFSCLWLQNAVSGESQEAIDDSRTAPALTLYPSPANGAYGVPTEFPGNEFPNPADEDGVPPGAQLGWLLSVAINGPWDSTGFGYTVNAHNVSATLAPDGTMSYVPVVVSQCGTSGCEDQDSTSEGSFFRGGFGIFPTQPLAPNTTYRVVLTSGEVTDHATATSSSIAGYSWCFSTGTSYTSSADCAPATTAAEEPGNFGASTVPSPPTPGGGATGTGSAGGGAGAAPPPPARSPIALCVVPRLIGKKLKASRRAVAARDCELGKVTKRDGATGKTGKVAHQSAKPGSELPAGTKIKITLK